ncbi:MAG: hypothetical protein GX230_00120 [Lentisphaerae bacterium]|nr:hypothetical protein [Lentisphaerota bacterium]
MIHDGDNSLLIMAYDLLFLDTDRWHLLNQRLRQALNLQPHQVLTNFSHTHAAPRISRWAYLDNPDLAYIDRIEEASIAAAKEAAKNCVKVTAEVGEATSTLPVSRRRYDPVTKTTLFLSTDDEPTYNYIPFLLLRAESGQVVSLLFSVSCHPSMMYENIVSADYPGPAVRLLNEKYNTNGATFLQGAGGDSKPRTIARPDEWKRGDWADVEATGKIAADAVIAAIETGTTTVASGLLRTALTETELPLQPPPDAATLDTIIYNPQTRVEKRLWASEFYYRLTLTGKLPAAVPLTVYGATLGDIFRIIAIPGEIVAEHASLVRTHFNSGITMTLGYTNGTPIYIPCDRQIPYGGYEVDSSWEYHWPSDLAPGIDGRISAAVKELQAQLAI